MTGRQRGIRVPFLVLVFAAAGASLGAAPLFAPNVGTWQEVARFAGTAVRGAQVFTVGEFAYVVSGMPNSCIPHHEVWRYGAAENAWKRLGDYPGTPIIEGVGFSIGATGYVCLGNANGSAGPVSEFWQYDPSTDSWTRKADFPGAARSGCVAVTIGQESYVFGGSSTARLSEIWEYDQETDAWTRKSDSPGGGRFLRFAFATAGKAYFGTGGCAAGMSQDVWEYDPSSHGWTRKADFPAAARACAVGLSVGGRGYVAFGLLEYSQPMRLVKDVWEYDAADDAWALRPEYAGTARIMTTSFVLGSDLYYGLGNNYRMQNVSDVWRMRPGQTAP